MLNFRKFMEDEAAPTMGGATAPPVPGSGEDTHNDTRVFDKEFDIDPSARKAADEADVLTIYTPLKINGAEFAPPIQVTITPKDNGLYEITALVGTDTHGTNNQKVRDMDGNDYYASGRSRDIKDYTWIVDKKFVDDLRAQSMAGMAAGGMADPMMGGMPPGGPGGAM